MRPGVPTWDLAVVLERLVEAPFEPLEVTWKKISKHTSSVFQTLHLHIQQTLVIYIGFIS